MGHCKDCKFWDHAPDYTWGNCELTGGRDGGAEHPESLAFAQDADGYGAALVTDPEFGCVQFVEKKA